jgi:hypothetical protein
MHVDIHSLINNGTVSQSAKFETDIDPDSTIDRLSKQAKVIITEWRWNHNSICAYLYNYVKEKSLEGRNPLFNMVEPNELVAAGLVPASQLQPGSDFFSQLFHGAGFLTGPYFHHVNDMIKRQLSEKQYLVDENSNTLFIPDTGIGFIHVPIYVNDAMEWIRIAVSHNNAGNGSKIAGYLFDANGDNIVACTQDENEYKFVMNNGYTLLITSETAPPDSTGAITGTVELMRGYKKMTLDNSDFSWKYDKTPVITVYYGTYSISAGFQSTVSAM